MIEAIFEGARARCRRHGHVVLAPGEKECEECKVIRRNLSLVPPFGVLCNRTHFGVEEGLIYTVLWVIRNGSKEFTEDLFGYVFRDKNGGIHDKIYSPLEFTPIVFLSLEERKKLGVPDPPPKPKYATDDFEAWYG